MNIKTTLKLGLVAVTLFATNAFADDVNWQYLDARYQQPSDSDIEGVAGEVSGHISKNWILQARANRLRLQDRALDLEMFQTQIDLSVGRIFSFHDRVSMALTAGYTRVQYETEIGGIDEDRGDDVANVRFALRAKIVGRLEAEGSVGMLFDDEDTSDVLWSAGLRYGITPPISVMIGASGIDSDTFDSDDVLYEIGFRFDLQD